MKKAKKSYTKKTPVPKKKGKALGTHIFIDLRGCDNNFIGDKDMMLSLMRTAVQTAHATEIDHVARNLGKNFHPLRKNTPPGVSIAVILDESHITCHTYADRGMCAIDIFTCGETAKPQAAVHYILHNIVHKEKDVTYHQRFFIPEE